MVLVKETTTNPKILTIMILLMKVWQMRMCITYSGAKDPCYAYASQETARQYQSTFHPTTMTTERWVSGPGTGCEEVTGTFLKLISFNTRSRIYSNLFHRFISATDPIMNLISNMEQLITNETLNW